MIFFEDKSYLAMDDSSRSLTERRSVRYMTFVTDMAYGGPVNFAAPSDFKAYMSVRGYEKVSEETLKDGTFYKFRKKSH